MTSKKYLYAEAMIDGKLYNWAEILPPRGSSKILSEQYWGFLGLLILVFARAVKQNNSEQKEFLIQFKVDDKDMRDSKEFDW